MCASRIDVNFSWNYTAEFSIGVQDMNNLREDLRTLIKTWDQTNTNSPLCAADDCSDAHIKVTSNGLMPPDAEIRVEITVHGAS